MRESKVEAHLRTRIEGLGGRCFKLVDQPGLPDRLVVLGGLWLVELKRPKGGRLSRVQRALHRELAACGAPVAVLKSIEEIDRWIATTFDPTKSGPSRRSSPGSD